MMQIKVFCPGRVASERVQRCCAGFDSTKTDRSRALSPRMETLVDIDPHLSMFPWFHRSAQTRSAWRDGADRLAAAVRLDESHPTASTERPSAKQRAKALQRPSPSTLSLARHGTTSQ